MFGFVRPPYGQGGGQRVACGDMRNGKNVFNSFPGKVAIERRSNFGNLPSVNLLAPELFFLF
jgi:hypothetical protein